MSVLIFVISVVLFILSLLIANLVNEKSCNRVSRHKLIWCMVNCIGLGLFVLYELEFLHFLMLLGWAFYIAYQLHKVMAACGLSLYDVLHNEPRKVRQ